MNVFFPYRFLWSNGSTSSQIPAGNNTTFTLTVTDSLLCSITMRVAGQTVLALDTTTKRDTVFTPFNQAKSLKIFPNPAREQFTVLLGDKDYGTIDIIAINGKIMKTYQVQRKSDNETIVDCADLPPGAYIVVFRRFNHDVLSGRVIIIK